MKRTIKQIIWAIVIVATLGLGGCASQKQAQRPTQSEQTKKPTQTKEQSQKFQIVSLDKVRGSVKEGWVLTITVANNTIFDLRLVDATAYVKHNGRNIGRVKVAEELIVPRRCTWQLDVPLRVTLSNPLIALSAVKNMTNGDFSGITADLSVTVATCLGKRTIEQNDITVYDLYKEFNMGFLNK